MRLARSASVARPSMSTVDAAHATHAWSTTQHTCTSKRPLPATSATRADASSTSAVSVYRAAQRHRSRLARSASVARPSMSTVDAAHATHAWSTTQHMSTAAASNLALPYMQTIHKHVTSERGSASTYLITMCMYVVDCDGDLDMLLGSKDSANRVLCSTWAMSPSWRASG